MKFLLKLLVVLSPIHLLSANDRYETKFFNSNAEVLNYVSSFNAAKNFVEPLKSEFSLKYLHLHLFKEGYSDYLLGNEKKIINKFEEFNSIINNKTQLNDFGEIVSYILGAYFYRINSVYGKEFVEIDEMLMFEAVSDYMNSIKKFNKVHEYWVMAQINIKEIERLKIEQEKIEVEPEFSAPESLEYIPRKIPSSWVYSGIKSESFYTKSSVEFQILNFGVDFTNKPTKINTVEIEIVMLSNDEVISKTLDSSKLLGVEKIRFKLSETHFYWEEIILQMSLDDEWIIHIPNDYKGVWFNSGETYFIRLKEIL